ncbi:hypothetical protein GQ600_25042 [Phytophthora cactorum]|nr:hypothetical protein GQ600_25042 [Phytophthora cactorum]
MNDFFQRGLPASMLESQVSGHIRSNSALVSDGRLHCQRTKSSILPCGADPYGRRRRARTCSMNNLLRFRATDTRPFETHRNAFPP